VNDADTIKKVRVVDGATLALLDTTGTLTQKYQARLVHGTENIELISKEDTVCARSVTKNLTLRTLRSLPRTDHAELGTLMPISSILKIEPLVEDFSNRRRSEEMWNGVA